MDNCSQRFRGFVRLAVTIAVSPLWGCHQQAGELFPVLEPPMVWPAQPEMPRIKLIGALSESRDLNAARTSAEIFAATLRGPRPSITFSGPHGVAYHPAGILAVADSSGAAVHIINIPNRSHLVSRGEAERPFAAPVGAAWAGERLFVSDAKLQEIVELDQEGNPQRRFGRDELVRPVGIAYIPQREQLYVVDGGAHVLRVYDTAGRAVRSLGGRGAASGAFNYPTHIAYDGAGRLAVADTGNFRIQILDLDGACLNVVGRKGDAAGDLALPKGVGFDSDGHLYVVDAQFENFQIFDAQGRLLLAVGEEGSRLGEFALPAGLTVDHLDRIWVADSANRRVQVFQYLKPAVDGQMTPTRLAGN